jgi:hypothetical protein
VPDKLLVEQPLQHRVEGAGPDTHHPVRAVVHFADDPVAVALLIGKGEQDLIGQGRQGKKASRL